MEGIIIRPAGLRELNTVFDVVSQTITEIYPHYYPAGAVLFFLNHHSKAAIRQDIQAGAVFVLENRERVLGTVTVKENEIDRLFVLPMFQKQGYGGILLDFAEKQIAQHHATALLCASFPAKGLYLHRGYIATSYHCISTENGDLLCYDEMEKTLQPRDLPL